MAKQEINIGTSPNSRTGDTLRTAFSKINQNFNEVYDELALLTGTTEEDRILDINIHGSVSDDNGNVMLNPATGKLSESAIPVNVPTYYQFTAQFDNAGNLTSISNFPANWSYTLSENVISISTYANKLPLAISYWGYQDSGEMRMRFPTPGYQAVAQPHADYRLDLYLSSVVTGADVNQYAIITILI